MYIYIIHESFRVCTGLFNCKSNIKASESIRRYESPLIIALILRRGAWELINSLVWSFYLSRPMKSTRGMNGDGEIYYQIMTRTSSPTHWPAFEDLILARSRTDTIFLRNINILEEIQSKKSFSKQTKRLHVTFIITITVNAAFRIRPRSYLYKYSLYWYLVPGQQRMRQWQAQKVLRTGVLKDEPNSL